MVTKKQKKIKKNETENKYEIFQKAYADYFKDNSNKITFFLGRRRWFSKILRNIWG